MNNSVKNAIFERKKSERRIFKDSPTGMGSEIVPKPSAGKASSGVRMRHASRASNGSPTRHASKASEATRACPVNSASSNAKR